MDPATLMLFLVGALAGGFVTGLTAFGTALVVSAVWLHFMDPVVVAPLAGICSITAQMVSLKAVWKSLQWRASAPFILGAFVGLPFGSWLLFIVHPDLVKIGIGAVLVGYAVYALLARHARTVTVDNRLADAAVGAVGGVAGGMAGISGPPPLIWCQLRGLPKAVQRGIYQPYNMIVLATAVVLHGLNGRIDETVGTAFLIAMPATLVGSALGIYLYSRIDDTQFKRIVLGLLLFSGLVLLVRQLIPGA